ncbi:MAG: LysM peptidoglycan-binding domain-containing protein [Acidobacteriia bacterium]|nr:LysM peptidoglycan-binding domain-containing protein [Terriglobia bacterium]
MSKTRGKKGVSLETARSQKLALLLGGLCFLFSVPTWGQEAGGVSVTFQYHNNNTTLSNTLLNNPLFSLAVPSLSNFDVRLDSYEYLPNWGVLKTSFDVVNSDNSVHAGRGMVELSDYRWRNVKFDFLVGDHPLNAYNLDFHLSSLFNPFANLRGAKITASTDRWSVTAFGGRVASLTGLFGESLQLTQQDMFGIRGQFQVSSKLKIGSSLIQTNNADQSLGRSVPQSTSIASSDAIYQLTKNIQLLGQLSFSRYSGDASLPQPQGLDFSYLAGAKYKTVRGSAEVSWMRLSPDLFPLTNFNIGDREGFFSNVNYQISRKFAVYGSFNRYHNNLLDSRLTASLNIDTTFVGGRYQLFPQGTLNFRYGDSNAQSLPGSPTTLLTHNRSWELDYSHSLGSWRLEARFDQNRAADFSNGLERNNTQRMELEIRKSWKNGSTAYVTVGDLRESQTGKAQFKSSLTGNAGLSWTVRPSLSLYAELNWQQPLEILRTSSFSTTSFNSGVNWSLPAGIQLSVNGQYNRTTNMLSLLDSLTLTPANLTDVANTLLMQQFNRYQFQIRIFKTFKWGQRPPEFAPNSMGSAAMPRLPREFGNIAGVVFNDLDGDGKLDEKKDGVSGVVVSLDGREKMTTNAMGHYEFKNVPVGLHSVGLDMLSLPAVYDAGLHPKVRLNVSKRTTSEASFPLLQLGKISGKVVLIDQADAALGNTQHELPGANIIIVLNETYKVTFTDEDGEFTFNNIPRGEYRVRIDPGTMPEFSKVATEPRLVVQLAPGEKKRGLKFVVELEPRPNRRVLVATQTLPRLIKMDVTPDQNDSAAGNNGVRAQSRETKADTKDEFSLTGKSKVKPTASLNGAPHILIHTVVTGETLQSLAVRYFHSEKLWPLIYNANKGLLDASGQPHAGQKLRIPMEPKRVQTSRQEKKPAAPNVKAALTSASAPPSKGNAPRQTRTISEVIGGDAVLHQVQSGETLGTISTKYYHTKEKWSIIYAANKLIIPDMNRLVVGQVLRIPIESRITKANAEEPGETAAPSTKTVSSSELFLMAPVLFAPGGSSIPQNH